MSTAMPGGLWMRIAAVLVAVAPLSALMACGEPRRVPPPDPGGEPEASPEASPEAEPAAAPDADPDAPEPEAEPDAEPEAEPEPEADPDPEAEPDPECVIDRDCGQGAICEGGRCAPGCRDPADCGVGATCRQGMCVTVECATDSECGAGSRCDQGACEVVGGANCAGDADCGFRWHCSRRGVCIEAGCEVNADCAPEDWCSQGVCAARRTEPLPVRFERRAIAGLDDHRTMIPDDVCEGCVFCGRVEGFGGALFDMDGDRDLDVFLGARQVEGQSPPCVFENLSMPGDPRFEPVAGACQVDPGGVAMAGVGIDVDDDGRDELAMIGQGVVRLARFSPRREVVDLMALFDEGDPRRRCVAGSAVAMDVDLDGLLDLVIGCQLHSIVACRQPPQDFEAQRNLAFRQRPDGQFELLEASGQGALAEALADGGITLALGVLDVDEDGLPDLLVGNDDLTESGRGGDRVQAPGVLMRRCAPGEGCLVSAWPFGRGLHAGGSFMGFGNVEVDGLGQHIYISDWGANRLVRFEGDQAVDVAVELGADVAYANGFSLFGWGVVVDDFDRNGLDDIYLTQGATWPGLPPEQDNHHDVLLLQRAGPGFVLMRHDEVGLSANTLDDSNSEQSPWGPAAYASRGAVKADLDGDGALELITAALMGRPRVQSEVPADPSDPPRCTLIPRPRVVPTYGHGFAVGDEAGRWRRQDVQGQMRFGASPWVMTTAPRGMLRFPSGAEVPFDCAGGPGPVEVEEPDWVALARRGAALEVALQMPWREAPPERVVIAVRDPSGQVDVRVAAATPAGWSIPLGAQDRAVMIQIDGRWVPRFFEVPR